jgi:N-acetylneuraminate lyase
MPLHHIRRRRHVTVQHRRINRAVLGMGDAVILDRIRHRRQTSDQPRHKHIMQRQQDRVAHNCHQRTVKRDVGRRKIGGADGLRIARQRIIQLGQMDRIRPHRRRARGPGFNEQAHLFDMGGGFHITHDFQNVIPCPTQDAFQRWHNRARAVAGLTIDIAAQLHLRQGRPDRRARGIEPLAQFALGGQGRTDTLPTMTDIRDQRLCDGVAAVARQVQGCKIRHVALSSINSYVLVFSKKTFCQTKLLDFTIQYAQDRILDSPNHPNRCPMTKPLSGMYAALMTALADDGTFSPERQRALNAYVLRQNLHGLYVGGSSGESGLLDTDTLLEQQAIVAEDAKGSGATLIAHVGVPSLIDSCKLARNAQKLGYHGLSALPPHSYPFSDAEILGYYKGLAAATDLPLIVYEVPIRTGRPLPLELLVALLDLPNVQGIKFTSTDLFKLTMLRALRPSKTYYFGFDEIYLSAAALGTDGGIGTTYNILGRLYAALDAAVRAGDLALARDAQAVSAEFVTALLDVGVLPGMKAALRACGIECGPTRAPMAAKVPDAEARMAELVARQSVKTWLV